MEVKNVIDIALTAGEILLSNGAENYRIEETVSKICKAYNYNGECIAMSNGLLLLIEDSNIEKITSMKKVKDKHVDLYRIELINSFSRNLQKKLLSYEEAKKILNEIEKAPNFTMRVRTMAACMTGFIYTLFFNGTVIDGITSIIICFITYILFEKVSQLGFFQFLEFFLAGVLIILAINSLYILTAKAPKNEPITSLPVNLKVKLYTIQPREPASPHQMIFFLSILNNMTGNTLPKKDNKVILISI